MRLDPAPERTVADLVRHVSMALELGERRKEVLSRRPTTWGKPCGRARLTM